jgi:hypothetical protein
MCPGVDSAYKNEYQDTPGSKAGRCVRLTTYHLLVPNVKKIRGLILPDPHGPVQACSGTALLLAYIGDMSSDHTKTIAFVEDYRSFTALHCGTCVHLYIKKLLCRFPLNVYYYCECRFWAAVGLLTGHTTLRTLLYKLGHTEGQECRLCGHDKEDSVHIVCVCPVLACKRYRILGSMLLKPEDLEKVRVSSLLSLLANTGLGLVS